ncbi:MAG: hypothetical protein M3Y71_11840 [Actinomycetota bacterium]|nr:hypothetical protein [Actinomycetota bacterium]
MTALLGLACAIAASLGYGVAAVLESIAARETSQATGLDPRLLGRLARSWRYLLGLALDGIAFVLWLLALRTLPLFFVEVVIAGSLAVTAVVSAVVQRTRLGRSAVAALVVVLAGLVLVALSAHDGAATAVGPAVEWGLLVATLLLTGLAVPAGRIPGPRGVAALSTVAGLAFGATSIAARLLPTPADGRGVLQLLAHPALWALALSGLVALLAYSTALQRGTVTQATAPLLVGETLVPAVVGIALLGDRTREGWGPVAVVGFLLAVAGAIALARLAEDRPPSRPSQQPSTAAASPLP